MTATILRCCSGTPFVKEAEVVQKVVLVVVEAIVVVVLVVYLRLASGTRRVDDNTRVIIFNLDRRHGLFTSCTGQQTTV